MFFNSLTFLVFLFLMVNLFWLTKQKNRMAILFLGSIVFYGFWRWDFVFLMLFSTLLDYFISLEMGKTSNLRHKKVLLLTTLIINLGLLVFFKYLFFITYNINNIFEIFNIGFRLDSFSLILPLGISFYTFQTISYSIDVYRNHTVPEKNFFKFGTYVTFFPQLVAGPILRASEVMNELEHNRKFKFQFLKEGGKRILYGLFLKVVLADNLAPIVDEGFALSHSGFTAIDIVTLSFLFGFQIYFDFAGYSHIAIGCAKLMGIHFPENFNFPYFAKSFKSFWQRWHISLSSWIRDYLYLPILGVHVRNKDSNSKGGIELMKNESTRNPNIALFLTWAIMGLWHGASWAFVFWGVYHAFFVFIERQTKKIKYFSRIQKPFLGFIIVLPIVMLSWIPFRSADLADTFILYSKLFLSDNYFSYSLKENHILVAGILFLAMLMTYIFNSIDLSKYRLLKFSNLIFQPIKFAVMAYYVFVFLRPISQFIYFQF